MNAETRLQNEILIALSARGDCTVWKNNTGALKADGRLVRFGLTGSPDIVGVVDGGLFVGLEVKTPTGRQSQPQKRFQHAIEGRRAFYGVVRSVSDAMAAVDQVLARARQRGLLEESRGPS